MFPSPWRPGRRMLLLLCDFLDKVSMIREAVTHPRRWVRPVNNPGPANVVCVLPGGASTRPILGWGPV